MKHKDVNNEQAVLTAVFGDDIIKANEVYNSELDLLVSYFSYELSELFSKRGK